jgi:ATP-dependent helicase HrpB
MLLPIDDILPGLRAALGQVRTVVLSAPPGAGKTTRVPPAAAEWFPDGKVLILEPRRLAAQRAAEYMALQRGEEVGRTVGYRIRGEARVSDVTRVEVVTEGILTRMLLDRPDLPGIGMVVFDEFHERSIHADLGLAMTIDAQRHVREDLRIIVMSATLDGVAVAHLLGDCPVVESSGRSYPVETHYVVSEADAPIESRIAPTVRRALRESEGDILVFLPGQREIRRVAGALSDGVLPPAVSVRMLYGEATRREQSEALTPSAAGRRKVILSTSIAETSLTIDGVTVVVDAGLSRMSRFDPRKGMSGLVTVPVSRAVADQRRGRAGRQGPGVCYRLWSEERHAQLEQYPKPEILTTDLAPLVLSLIAWGSPDGAGLRFLDAPPPAHWAQGRALLTMLEALDERGKITPHGRAMASLPVHPRLSHMILKGSEMGYGVVACECAALLSERDVFPPERYRDIDLVPRWRALRCGDDADRQVRARVLREARRLRTLAGVRGVGGSAATIGLLLALAYPDRIGKRRDAEGHRYVMSGGTGAVLPAWSPLVREEYLAIAEVDAEGTEARIFRATGVTAAQLTELFPHGISDEEDIRWSGELSAVVARRVVRLGSLVLKEMPVGKDAPAIRDAMLEGVRAMGLASLPWNREALSLHARSEWVRRRRLVDPAWPSLSDEALLVSPGEWLAPFLRGMTTKADLQRLDMTAILKSLFSTTQLKELDRLAPAMVTVPTGSRLRLDYDAGEVPVLAVRLQEMFGEKDSPTVGGGSVRVLLHLLSPAGRPLAVTSDLGSFWRNAYQDVRKEMRGRYPKHHWPEDPCAAPPTKRTKRRS